MGSGIRDQGSGNRERKSPVLLIFTIVRWWTDIFCNHLRWGKRIMQTAEDLEICAGGWLNAFSELAPAARGWQVGKLANSSKNEVQIPLGRQR